MKNHNITTGKGKVAVASIFSHLALGEHEIYAKQENTLRLCRIYHIIGLKVKDEYLILVTNLEPKNALGFYKRRWEIETLFSAFKTRGFNLEETHMSNPDRNWIHLFTILIFSLCLVSLLLENGLMTKNPLKP